jgi:hypothetical protein
MAVVLLADNSPRAGATAFSSEVGIGSREENASQQETISFHRLVKRFCPAGRGIFERGAAPSGAAVIAGGLLFF